jgi:hypothetical protein
MITRDRGTWVFRIVFQEIGSVEILKRNKQSLLGASAYRASAPPLMHPPKLRQPLRRLTKNSRIKGVKGMLPLGCFSLWGREGVPLIAAGGIRKRSEK